MGLPFVDGCVRTTIVNRNGKPAISPTTHCQPGERVSPCHGKTSLAPRCEPDQAAAFAHRAVGGGFLLRIHHAS